MPLQYYAVLERVQVDQSVQLQLSFSFDELGIHFSTARVTSQRDGDVADIRTRIHNLSRVRVVTS